MESFIWQSKKARNIVRDYYGNTVLVNFAILFFIRYPSSLFKYYRQISSEIIDMAKYCISVWDWKFSTIEPEGEFGGSNSEVKLMWLGG